MKPGPRCPQARVSDMRLDFHAEDSENASNSSGDRLLDVYRDRAVRIASLGPQTAEDETLLSLVGYMLRDEVTLVEAKETVRRGRI